MRIIDRKGMLFGMINVIDFLVIIFFISLSPMFYFGYRIFKQNPPEVKVQAQPERFIMEEQSTSSENKLLAQLATLEKRMDSSLAKLTGRINKLEDEIKKNR